MQVPVLLDRLSHITLTVQIAEQLREGIRTGRIMAGARMPSSRQLAEQLDVSRNTVVRAYEMLDEWGFVETRPASGIYAAAETARQTVPRAVALPPSSEDDPGNLPPPERFRAQRLVNPTGNRLSFDFFPGRPSARLFPAKTWRRLMNAALSRGGPTGLSEYSDPGGLFSLRSAIASHVAMSRGILAEPGCIVIVAGVQEGLSLSARLFLGPGRRAAVESPCYQGAAFAFEATGAEVEAVPVDEDGLIVDSLPTGQTSLLYTTPSHQYPTGSTLSLERRKALVGWARRMGCYIVEDDYDSDFQYEGSPLPAVAAIAPDVTIYLGTFSKSLGAGLRLGYMILPPSLVDAALSAKTLLNNGCSWLDQSALAAFVQSGSFAAHVSRCRVQYRENRDVLIQALRRHFGDVAISGETAGLHLFWQLPSGVPEAGALEKLARKSRVGIYSLVSGGAFEPQESRFGRRGILLGYSSLTPRQIEQGISRLSDVIDDTLDARPAFVDELLVHEPIPFARARQPASRIRQKPALHAAREHRAESPHEQSSQGAENMQRVRGIYRYPVKGLSPEPLSGIVLEAGKPFPFDRVFAFARPGVPMDYDNPKWAKKGLFIMLMLEEALASVQTSLDPDTLLMTVKDGGRTILTAGLATPDGRVEFEAFVRQLVPTLRDRPRLVRSLDGHFMDKPDNVLSMINLETVRALEAEWGYPIDPLRFRANFYVDGLRPWQENDWIGSDIRLGDVVFRVDRRNGRCGATNVNPATGARDLDIPASLRAAFGHKDLGVYLVARSAGKVVVGDPLSPPQHDDDAVGSPAKPVTANASAPGTPRHICRGCYYIYDEAHGYVPDGISPGTTFAEIPESWRCPDCGTEKANFRPFVQL